MTTSEFIKMLQEEDPSGEAHIRLGDGVPYSVELKEGYWDGPYSYINENEQYVTTTKGMKVDIYCKTSSDIVWDLNWISFQESREDLKKRLLDKFVYDYTYSDPKQKQERIDNNIKHILEELEEYMTYKEESDKKCLEEVVEKYKSGWRFYQLKNGKMTYYSWRILNTKSWDEGANYATTGPILNSGIFTAIDRGDEYLEWVLIEDYEKAKYKKTSKIFDLEKKLEKTKKKPRFLMRILGIK